MIHNKKILQKWTQTTKARLGRHLQHLAWKRRGPILVLALHKFVTYSLTYLLRHLPTTGPTWGDHQWNHWCWRPMNNYFRYNQTCETNACSPTNQKTLLYLLSAAAKPDAGVDCGKAKLGLYGAWVGVTYGICCDCTACEAYGCATAYTCHRDNTHQPRS